MRKQTRFSSKQFTFRTDNRTNVEKELNGLSFQAWKRQTLWTRVLRRKSYSRNLNRNLCTHINSVTRSWHTNTQKAINSHIHTHARTRRVERVVFSLKLLSTTTQPTHRHHLNDHHHHWRHCRLFIMLTSQCVDSTRSPGEHTMYTQTNSSGSSSSNHSRSLGALCIIIRENKNVLSKRTHARAHSSPLSSMIDNNKKERAAGGDISCFLADRKKFRGVQWWPLFKHKCCCCCCCCCFPVELAQNKNKQSTLFTRYTHPARLAITPAADWVAALRVSAVAAELTVRAVVAFLADCACVKKEKENTGNGVMMNRRG